MIESTWQLDRSVVTLSGQGVWWFRTEPVSLRTTSGSTLSDLYNLTIKATSEFNGVPEETTLSIYVYKPAQ